MNEDVRMAKIAYSDRVNKVRQDFYGNFLLYGLLLLPVAYWSRRLFVARGGIPITNTYDSFLSLDQTTLKEFELMLRSSCGNGASGHYPDGFSQPPSSPSRRLILVLRWIKTMTMFKSQLDCFDSLI